ncbi:MAG TPA: hypothetical protein VJ351_21420 [Streptosporangiaceae bacterium]|nr:hypothetical protein [Streptosporangiaceae bacterium]
MAAGSPLAGATAASFAKLPCGTACRAPASAAVARGISAVTRIVAGHGRA